MSRDTDPGLAMVPTNIRFRDGSISNRGATDLNGYMPFNEVFPLFNWYVVEADTTRYKQTGVHVVYDAGGQPDDPVNKLGGQSKIAAYLANLDYLRSALWGVGFLATCALYALPWLMA